MSIRELISDHIAEVVFLLFKIGESMLDPSVRLYLYEGVCLELYGSKNITDKCTAQAIASAIGGDSESRESAIQAAASQYLVAYKFLMNAPALVLGFFCGSWSDSIGRKIPVLLSLIATTAAVLLYAISMFVDATGRGVPAIPLVLVGALIRGGVGRAAVITMALYSLVCDKSSRQNRTKKIGRLLSMSYFGYFIGSLAAGALLEIYGFDIIFSFVLLVDIVCIILVVTMMEKDEPTSEVLDDTQQQDGMRNGEVKTGVQRIEQPHQSKFAEWSSRMMPFRWIYIVNSIQVLTRKRHHRTRLHMLVFIFIIFVHQTCKSGETDVTLLFAEAAPLSWRKSMYGYLLATDYALLGVSVLVLLPLLIKLFKLSDANLVLFGLVFRVARLFALSMSKSTFEVFFSSFVGCPSSMIVSCCKATVSKMVGDDERGKVFALMSCAETVAMLVGSVIFTGVYKSTRDFFPGLVFIFEALFFLAFIVVIWFVGQDMKKAAQYEEVKEIAVEDLDKKDVVDKNEQPIADQSNQFIPANPTSNINRNPFSNMEILEGEEFTGMSKPDAWR